MAIMATLSKRTTTKLLTLAALTGVTLAAVSPCEAQTTQTTHTAYPARYATYETEHFNDKVTLTDLAYTTPDKTQLPLIARDAEGHYQGHTYNYFALYYRYWTFIIQQLPISAMKGTAADSLWRVLIAYSPLRDIASFDEQDERDVLEGFSGKWVDNYFSSVSMADGALVTYGTVKDADIRKYDFTRFTEIQTLYFIAKFATPTISNDIWTFISPSYDQRTEFLDRHEDKELPFIPTLDTPWSYTKDVPETAESVYSHLVSNSFPQTASLYNSTPPLLASGKWRSFVPGMTSTSEFFGTMIHSRDASLDNYATTDVYAMQYTHWLFIFCRIASNDPSSSHPGSYRLIAKRYNKPQTLSLDNIIAELNTSPFLTCLIPNATTSDNTLSSAYGFVCITDAADYILKTYDIARLDITRLLYLIARYGNQGGQWNEDVGDKLWTNYLSLGLTCEEFLRFYNFKENVGLDFFKRVPYTWPTAPLIPPVTQ
jgi:hypothetical protein